MAGDLHVVILAGGRGERFWPLSTPENPKPFLKFFSERSLLQQTFDRALRLAPPNRIFLVVGRAHVQISREQLPELPETNLLQEPAGRDTSAAIGFAALHLPEDALMLVLPADHLIPDSDAFQRIIGVAAWFVSSHGGPCTFGIRPDRPETNYGYVKVRPEPLAFPETQSSAGVPPANSQAPDGLVYAVEKFVEKPDRERAKEFILHGSYYWNSGIFLWKVSRIRDLLQRHLPELWSGLQKTLQEGDPVARQKLYESLPRISIDFGVMQKADNVVVVPATFRWDDIGTWNSLPRVLNADPEGNLVWGSHYGLDTANCILYAESHTMVTAGIRDLVVVQRGSHTLICHRDYADRLKELLAKLPS